MAKKVLKAHTGGHYHTEGKEYEVRDEDERAYVIIDDDGDPHEFTKQPDYRGSSYATWFEVKEVE